MFAFRLTCVCVFVYRGQKTALDVLSKVLCTLKNCFEIGFLTGLEFTKGKLLDQQVPRM